MGKYEIHQRKGGNYYFYLKAANGMVIATSQNYASKAGLYNAIESVRRHSSTETIEDLTEKPKPQKI